MKLLIICQKVDENDDLLGFFIGWIREFAKKAEQVSVICLSKGDLPAGGLPANVEIISLGKERGVSRLGRWLNFYKALFRVLPEIDVIFSHMCPIYTIAVWPAMIFSKKPKKKNTLWYAHGAVSRTLRIAVFLADLIFTSSGKGCRIKSRKVKVVGQGIDTEIFKQPSSDDVVDENLACQILTVGRISPSKGYETLVEAIEIIVKEHGPDIKVKVIGKEGMSSQKEYFEKLKQTVIAKGLAGNISFLGSVANKDTARHYQKARLFVNMSTTGSLDKTVLEAMACGTPVVTCNEAFKNVLEERFLYRPGDAEELAKKMKIFITEGQAVPPDYWRQIVLRDHSLNKLVDKILVSL